MSAKIITKIEIQKKKKGRCSIYLDDEFAFGLDQNVLLRFGLKKGDHLSDDKINEIIIAEEKQTAKERAIKLLSYRDRSEREIMKRLKEIGYKDHIIDFVISELKRLQLLNDTRFAITFAKSKMITKPSGNYLLRRELLNKGVKESDVELALKKAYQEKSEIEIAQELASKKFQRYKNLDEMKAKKRVSDFLLRRGFSWDVVSEVLEVLVNDE